MKNIFVGNPDFGATEESLRQLSGSLPPSPAGWRSKLSDAIDCGLPRKQRLAGSFNGRASAAALRTALVS